MLKVQLSIPDLKAQVLSLREMAQDPMALLQSLTAELRPRFEEWMNDNHRNGLRSRRLTLKGLGTLGLRIPRDREGTYGTDLVPDRIQYDLRIEQDLQMLLLGGASTRTVELMSERLFGRRPSSGEVSQANKKLLEPAEAWGHRSLADEAFV
jgi:transposase-like protein